MIEAKWRPDRQHPFANFQVFGIAQLQRRQILAIDLDQRDVRILVGADHLGVVHIAVVETHDHFIGIGHDMMVGQDITIFRNNETGAERAGFAFFDAIVIEKFLEQFTKRRAFGQIGNVQMLAQAILFQLGVGADVDDGVFGLVNDVGKIRQLCESLVAQQQHEQGGK